MKVAVIGGSGNAGRHVVAELARRGHAVTVVSRNAPAHELPAGATHRAGDIEQPEALAAIIRGHDAVVSSVKFVAFDPEKLLGAIRKSGVRRYVVVGGAGSLKLPDGTFEFDRTGYPEPARINSKRGGAYLAMLAESDLDWTFLSPSRKFIDGARTGRFRLGLDDMLFDASGESSISFQDYAMALTDELEQPRHLRRRFTVGY
jgi:putative NADH-flavin reductase